MSPTPLYTRRAAIAAFGTLAGVAALATTPTASRAATQTGDDRGPAPWLLGLQLYTLGDAPKRDLDATLKEVASIGYRSVQLPQPYGRSAKALRRSIDAAGLICPSVHIAPRATPGAWSLDEDVSHLADDLYGIGAGWAVVSIVRLPDRVIEALSAPPPGGFSPADILKLVELVSPDDWKRTAELMNEKATMLARSGIGLAYHNHAFDFLPIAGGPSGFELLVKHTDPSLVSFEIDVGWAAGANQDLGELFRQLSGRIRLMHLKDAKAPSQNPMELAPANLGTGIVDWQSLFALVQAQHVRYLFVEQEPPFEGVTPMQASRIAFEFVTKHFP